MPYKSEKQRRYLHAKHPDIAARWDAEEKKKVSKQAPSKRLRYQKKVSAGTSIAGGTLGLGGLAALAMKKNDLATKLAIGSSGLGGLGAYNYASIQNQEAKIGQRKRIKKEAGFDMMDFGLDGANPQEVSKRSAEEANKIENAAFGGSAGALGTGYFGSKAYQSAKAGYGLSRGTLGYSKKGSAKSAVKAAGSGLKGAANLTRAMEAAYNKPGTALALGVGGAIAGGKAMEHKLKKSKVAKKDWMNISEHERRARDSRRTRKRGESAAGLGGAALAGTVAHRSNYARNRAPVFEQVGELRDSAVNIGRNYKWEKKHTSEPTARMFRNVRSAVKQSPHGAAAVGAAGLMGAGAATMAGARMNEKRHDRAIARQRKSRVNKALKMPKVAKPAVAAPKVAKPQMMQQPQIAKPKPPKMPRPEMVGKRDLVFKAYNPEDRRHKRAQGTATAMSVGSGAAALGAGYQGVKAVGKKPYDYTEKRPVAGSKKMKGGEITVHHKNPGTGLRSKELGEFGTLRQHIKGRGGKAPLRSPKGFKGGLRSAGAAGALGLTAVGLAVGSERVRSYDRKGRGATYRPLHRGA